MCGDIGLRIVYSTVVQVVNDPKNGEQSQRCIAFVQKMVALLRVVSVKLHRYEEKVRILSKASCRHKALRAPCMLIRRQCWGR